MALDVTKEVKKALSVIKSNGFEGKQFQTTIMLDVSGSAQWMFKDDGVMSNLLQRSIALSMIVDPDKAIEAVAFSDSAVHLGELGELESFDPMDTFLLRTKGKGVLWKGTDYSEAFKILNADSGKPKASLASKLGNFFSAKKKESVVEPRLVLFVSDGEDYGNKQELRSQLNKVIDGKTFVIMLGVGARSHFGLMEELDNEYFGLAFVHVPNAESIDNDSFYSILLNDEFKEWMTK